MLFDVLLSAPSLTQCHAVTALSEACRNLLFSYYHYYYYYYYQSHVAIYYSRPRSPAVWRGLSGGSRGLVRELRIMLNYICEMETAVVNMQESTSPSLWRLIKEVTTVTDSTDSEATMSPTSDQRFSIRGKFSLRG